MVSTVLAKVEVEKSSLQKSIWQFYVRMGHKRRLCPFFGGPNFEFGGGGVKILNFNRIFLRGSEKINILGGMKSLWIVLGDITKLDYFW